MVKNNNSVFITVSRNMMQVLIVFEFEDAQWSIAHAGPYSIILLICAFLLVSFIFFNHL